MKAFWALLGLLAIAAVVVVATELGGNSNPAPATPSATNTPTAPAQTEPAPKPTIIAFTDKPEPPKPPPPSPLVVIPDPSKTPAAAQAIEPTPGEAKVADPTPTEATKPPAETTQPAPIPPAAPTGESSPKPSPAAPQPEENLLLKIQQDIAAENAAAAARKASAEATPPPAAEPDGPFGKAKAEVKPDGSLLVEGKYVIKGKGTQAEPYKVTWDHLISAQHDYNPKEGQKTIPARIQALHDKWIEITGYIAFPLMSNETDELLSMMNQWDGCCIGIPPTPYDAIEVRLTNAVSGDSRLTTYGSLKGVFKVDPHLVGGWLVGLYVMDQGKLTPVAYGGVAP